MKIRILRNISDIYVNINKFKDSKILLITGLSGSGKSTLAEEISKKYNATSFQIEWLIHSKYVSIYLIHF